jgi:hypothetical protein
MPTYSSMWIDSVRSWERNMETAKDPFEAVGAMMHENLDKVGSATQSYLDMVEKTMRAIRSK